MANKWCNLSSKLAACEIGYNKFMQSSLRLSQQLGELMTLIYCKVLTLYSTWLPTTPRLAARFRLQIVSRKKRRWIWKFNSLHLSARWHDFSDEMGFWKATRDTIAETIVTLLIASSASGSFGGGKNVYLCTVCSISLARAEIIDLEVCEIGIVFIRYMT